MTMGDEEGAAEAVGYGRPPKSGRFRKGQSGNPRGRPPKPTTQSALVPARFPTRALLRAEAARPITVTDASGRQTLPSAAAVTRALLLKAMRGGVLAQRTVLQLLLAEDERFHREYKERVEFWQNYKERSRAALEAARKAGEDPPDFLPHPDDVVLNWHTLEVRFLGAIDEEERIHEKMAEAAQDLGYEMAVYTGEDNRLPDKSGEGGRLGRYMALYVLTRIVLPPRLQRSPASYETHIKAMAARGQDAWGKDLEQRCCAAGVPFVCLRRGAPPPTFPFARFGIKGSTGTAGPKASRRATRR